VASADTIALTFGRLRLEPDDGLWRGRTRIPLPPKETALLRLLAESKGRIVSKTEIFDRVWPGEDVGEASITRCMLGLRRALHEGGRRGGTIETVHGRGYRMAIAVQSTAAPSEVTGVTSLRVAMGPFENASTQPQDEYLGPGIAGEVTNCLTQTRANGITVIARQSALRLQRGAPDLLRIAGALRLDYVVTGWLRREGGELRVQVEIVRVSDEALVWSEEFRERRSRISRLPAAIATSVAAELGRRSGLSMAGRSVRASVQAKSYRALLQGQFASQHRTERGVRRGIALFERAIEWDPGDAEPYALLADAHLMLGFWGYEAPLAIAPRVGTFVQRALALDPRRVSALASLAYLRCSIDYEPAASMRAVEQAAAREPGHARTEWARGQLHLSQGRFDAAHAAFEASLDTDPFSPPPPATSSHGHGSVLSSSTGRSSRSAVSPRTNPSTRSDTPFGRRSRPRAAGATRRSAAPGLPRA
jgi:DNA-binding winged helix-turn-helix (wHTH) protein/tetratricopeptide (TPR) repeat protein